MIELEVKMAVKCLRGYIVESQQPLDCQFVENRMIA